MSKRWWMLLLLSVAELLGMSLWFTASAVAGQLANQWALSPGEAAWLTTVVQLGFVVGTALAALANLADLLPARFYLAVCALLAAAANAGMLVASDYRSALVCRFLTGFFLAGVYPPAMKMIATWFRERRGLAIGTIVGALTVGKATPYVVRAIGSQSVVHVIAAASIAALVASVLVAAFYRDGPHRFARKPFRLALVAEVIRHRPTRLAIGGYLGHMWELYAMWTWAPAFVVASVLARGGEPGLGVDLVAFGAIASGGLGCVWGGLAADRVGRDRLVILALRWSGGCCLLAGLVFAAPLPVVAVLVWVWGFFVVADSAQFSAMVTEVAPAHAVGTALTLQTSLGFLLTMATIQAVPAVVELAGWRWAFAMLILGPVAGIAATKRFSACLAARSRTAGGSGG